MTNRACNGAERESGAKGVIPALIPALSRVASWADVGHVESATARTAAAAMNFDIVNSVLLDEGGIVTGQLRPYVLKGSRAQKV
jgi:hypothetical protein